MKASRPQRLFLERMKTPIGVLALVAGEDGRLHGTGFLVGHAHMERGVSALVNRPGTTLEEGRCPGDVRDAMERYFAGELAALDTIRVVTDVGTEFQRDVWKMLRRIPCGETWSYGELARRIGRPAAVRAVGLANGANPIGVVVPCHRVIGSDGSLTGYGGGIERKRWLLAHEGAGGGRQASLPGVHAV
ncbi:MAG TPA: methylated-DNA--[protein]-cysteine S-methyltransferase [Polyangiaceae bacterium]|jgi:methylated-DNA-[protein]-cysteine S-methyltransferase